MSESLRRKSSSRQLLQNLIRVTAQRSQEDAEEVERERRRRSREKERDGGSPIWPDPPQHNDLEHNTESDGDLKPSCCLVLEEDEGFSDWSHRLENRNEHNAAIDCRARGPRSSTPEPEKVTRQDEEEEEACEEERSSLCQEGSPGSSETMSTNRQEVRTSFSSSVFIPQESRQHATGQPPDRTSYLVTGMMKPRGGSCRVDGQVKRVEQQDVEEVQAAQQTETRQNLRDEDELEEEESNFSHGEKKELQLRREEEEEEEEEEEDISDQRSVEDRRSEEVNRRSTRSFSSSSSCSGGGGGGGGGEEESLNCYGPMSPTFKKLLIQFYPDEVNCRVSTEGQCKIIERTESLRKSTSNIKKTRLPVSKIDKKLEQYTNAIEVSSKDSRPGSQLMDRASSTEPVSSKKNLFEAGEVRNQNTLSVTASKDADGLKVGVADLINQWVKGGEDGSRSSSPSRPAEGSCAQRFRFVVTGHGKYEKVSVDDGGCGDASCRTDGLYDEDL